MKVTLTVLVMLRGTNDMLAFLCSNGATIESVAPMGTSRVLITFSVDVGDDDAYGQLAYLEMRFSEEKLDQHIVHF